MQSTAQSFRYVRSKVRKWKAGDLLPTRRDQSWERVQAIATTQRTPILEELLRGLKMAGKKTGLKSTSSVPYFSVNEVMKYGLK